MSTLENIDQLLSLPSEIVAFLSAGYIGYRLAFTGKDATHSTVDVVFLSFVFAFLAKTTAQIASMALPQFELSWLVVLLIGFVGALCLAGFWRRFGENWAFQILRTTGISGADRHLTAWQTVACREGAGPTQLIVRKTDRSSLMCERLADFEKAPFGPCVFGHDGSVAMYVTDFRDDAGIWDTIGTLEAEDDWGPAITIVPAHEIAEVEIRHSQSSFRFGRGR